MSPWLLVSSALGAPCPSPTPVRTPPTSLREVDWCNRDYQTVWGPLVNGQNESHEWELDISGHSTTLTSLLDVLYLENDEALAVIVSNTWLVGGGAFGDGTLVLYAWRDGAPVEVARGDAMPFDRIRQVGDAFEGHWTWAGGESVGLWKRDGATFVLVPATEVRTPAVVAPAAPEPRGARRDRRKF